ncbi:MAG: hypothetical protein P8012_00190 [Desulfobacterales bacterium]
MAIIKSISVPKTTDVKELRKWFEQISEKFSYQSYAGDPTSNILPRWTGDLCLDTTNNDWYKATGTAAADWKALT